MIKVTLELPDYTQAVSLVTLQLTMTKPGQLFRSKLFTGNEIRDGAIFRFDATEEEVLKNDEA